MPFTGQSFDPETLALLTAVFNDAWDEIQRNITIPAEAPAARPRLALVILDAASTGERDPRLLKIQALRLFCDVPS